MNPKNGRNFSYFEMTEHTTVQIIIFLILVAFFVSVVFFLTLPMTEYVLVKFLSGEVHNDGRSLSKYIDMSLPLIKTDYLTRWGVDIYQKTSQEARYWFNPLVSFSLISAIIGLIISVVVSTLIPQSVGYMRHKIEREISNILSKISEAKSGSTSDKDIQEVISEIMNSELKEINEYLSDWNLNIDDIRILKRALKWRQENFFYRLFHINEGVTMYMRFYFTVKYSNATLGFVYIGAAVLIIIIGLRGLKFIPPTEPSLILFALGLEFSLLVLYAITLMYTKQDDDSDFEQSNRGGNYPVYMGNDFGSAREIEKLLRVFIKSGDKKKLKK